MPRDHHYAFAKKILPGHCWQAPDKVFGELRGPMREAFLMFLWTECGKTVASPLPHVGTGPRTPGGPEEVIALNVVGAEVRQGMEIIVVQMPPAMEANEAWFVALTRVGPNVRVFTWERSMDGEAVLAELQQSGRANYGFHPDTSLAGFLTALSNVVKIPLQNLSVPTSTPMDAMPPQGRPLPKAPHQKSIIGPMILMLLAGAPGALTFMFALNESSSFSGDWVLISMPLLIITGVSFAWMLSRMLGKVGLAVGSVVVSIGFSGAFIILGQKIDAREEWRKNSRALQDTEAFCKGDGEPDDRAIPYDADGGGPYKTVVYEDLVGGKYSSIKSSYAPEFDAWDPKPFQIQNAALVACLERFDEKLQTCNYDMGASVTRQRSGLEIELYSIESGEKIFTTKLEGGEPRPCEGVEKFYGESRHHTISGDLPSMGDVRKALKPHVDP